MSLVLRKWLLIPPLLFAFYSKYLEAFHTWKFLTLQTFLLRILLWKKKIKNLVLTPLRALWKSVQKPSVLERGNIVPVLLHMRVTLCVEPFYMESIGSVENWWFSSQPPPLASNILMAKLYKFLYFPSAVQKSDLKKNKWFLKTAGYISIAVEIDKYYRFSKNHITEKVTLKRCQFFVVCECSAV